MGNVIFSNLLENSIIFSALEKAFINKFLREDYVDMSKYVKAFLDKKEWFSKLKKEKSNFSDISREQQLNTNKIISYFDRKMPTIDVCVDLTVLEAEGIALLIFKSIKKSKRLAFSEEALKYARKDTIIKQIKNVFYDFEKVKLEFIMSINSLSRILDKENCVNSNAFYRGQSNANQLLKPSIYRTENLKANEYYIYNEIQKACPEDFIQCKRHVEKLVKMQHYGSPTRLLDITKNPLVALYFACVGNKDSYGEVVIMCAEENKIKYPQSDNVSILAGLPFFKYEEQEEFKEFALKLDEKAFLERIERLSRVVRLEKPDFVNRIHKDTILDNFFVLATQNNKRIMSQDGAFILCGLENDKFSVNDYRYKRNDKKIIVLVDNKESILNELDLFGINKAKLFPEIETVALSLKDKFK